MIGRIVTSLALAGLLATSARAASGTTWYVPGDFDTIQAAVDDASVRPGDRILVGAGAHDGALVSKRLTIEGADGAVIDDGPLHPAGLTYGFRMDPGSDGSVIRSLTFDGVDLAIMNSRSAAGSVDDVTVVGNTFLNAIQAVSNWRGSGWTIARNRILDLRTDCGGGIGILVGDYSGGTVTGNVVEHNAIGGVLHVAADDCGDYNGTGIVLYADFRWGRLGSEGISGNYVGHNDVGLTVDDPRPAGVWGPVGVVGIELTEARDVVAAPVIVDNTVEFNDLRGTDLSIVLTPEDLGGVNDLSRNLGYDENRGQTPGLGAARSVR